MGFSIVCNGCGKLLYQGNQMILLYKLRNEIDNRCQSLMILLYKLRNEIDNRCQSCKRKPH